MEIRRYDDLVGVVALENLVDGTFVVMRAAANDQGLTAVGVRKPINATEALEARQVVTWPQINTPFPGPLSWPSLAYSLRRGGFDQAQTQPFSSTVYLTNPGMQELKTIPSGFDCVVHRGDDCVLTIPSGQFVHNASLATGALIEALNVADDTTDAGKAGYTIVAANGVGEVVEYDAPHRRLTVRLFAR